MDKKNIVMSCVRYGFWAMIALFVLTIIFSFVGLQIVSDILSILFMLSLLYVLITSVMAIAPPEKRLAYVALTIAILFILIILLIIFSLALGGATGTSIAGLK